MKEKNTYIFIISILCFMTLACKNNLFTIEKESNSNKAYVSFSDTGIGRAADNAPDFFQSENLDEESVTKVVFIAKTSNDEKKINKEFTPDIENKRNAVEVFKNNFLNLMKVLMILVQIFMLWMLHQKKVSILFLQLAFKIRNF